MLDPDRRIGQVDKEHASPLFGLGHDDPHAGSIGTGDETFAPVDHPVVPVLVASGLHHRRVRAGPAFQRRLGHEERAASASFNQGFEETLLQFGAADLAQEVHVAFIRGHGVAGQRPQRGQPALLQDMRCFGLAEVATARQDVRGQNSGLTSLPPHLIDQLIQRGAMMIAARIGFVGHHHLAHEAFDPLPDFKRTLCSHCFNPLFALSV